MEMEALLFATCFLFAVVFILLHWFLLPYLLLHTNSFFAAILFPVSLICFATSLMENGGTLCDFLSFCCIVCFVALTFAALLLLYTHPFSLPAMLPCVLTTIKVCVYLLEKRFSNAIETS